MTQQLALPLLLREEATFDNFYPGNNATAIKALKSLLAGDGERFIYFWGESSVGRSHLLQAACHDLFQHTHSVIYISLRSNELSPEILQDIETLQLVCIDDIDAVLGQYEWEEALLHFYNRVRDGGMRMIMAGNAPPLQLPATLADLRTRMAWGLVFQIVALTDEQKVKALQLHAHRRGIELSDEVGHFLLRHYPRDMAVLFRALDQLDQASLAEQRKLTVPFVKQVLGSNPE